MAESLQGEKFSQIFESIKLSSREIDFLGICIN